MTKPIYDFEGITTRWKRCMENGDYPHGAPFWRYMRIHKKNDDLYSVDFEGDDIVLFHRNGDIDVRIPKHLDSYLSAGYNNRVHDLLKLDNAALTIWIKKSRSVTGPKYNVYVNNKVIGTFNRCITFRWNQNAYEVSLPRDEGRVVNLANKKQFYDHLREFKLQMLARIRMGTVSPEGKFREQFAKEVDAKQSYIGDDTLRHMFYKTVIDWVQTGDVKAYQRGVELACAVQESYYGYHKFTQQKQIDAVKSMHRWIQSKYLKEECVTIVTPQIQTGADDDQDVVVQQVDGLREVQVFSEVEVC